MKNNSCIRPLSFRSLFILTAVAAILTPGTAQLPACTLWGAAGEAAVGGTIVSKNRDWAPNHTQVLKMVRPEHGYPYYGLYAVGGTEPGIKAGVNQPGLTVVTASASSIPKDQTASQPGKQGVISRLLSGYATCDEVLAHQAEIFPSTRAMFVLIGDRQKVLIVEIGLQGKYALKTIEKGYTVHTNHFLEDRLAEFNIKVGSSSKTRLGRIDELMKSTSQPYQLDDMARLSKDQHDGPDNSLWRTGTKSRTLASWIVQTPAKGPATLRVVIADPDKKEQTKVLTLDAAFWQNAR